MNQSWRDRLSSSRPAGEPIRTQDYEVAAIDDDNTAKRFVTTILQRRHRRALGSSLPYPKLHQEAA